MGSSYVLNWSTVGVTGPLAVELNRVYPGGVWETLWDSTDNDGVEAWTVSGPEAALARVRIRSLDTPTAADTSNANFFIVANLPPALHLTSPNGIENWAIGTTRTVTWTTVNVPGNLRLELKRDFPAGPWESINENLANTGSYAWAITGPTSLTSRLRLLSISLPGIGDTSDGNFFINVPPLLSLGAPNGGEVWTVGENRLVTWTSTGIVGDVALEIDRAYPSGDWTGLTTTLNDDEYLLDSDRAGDR